MNTDIAIVDNLPPQIKGAFNVSPTAERKEIRAHILSFEDYLNSLGGAEFEVEENHSFSEGVYVRSVFLKAGDLITGKIHKTEHSNIISMGDVSVLTEWGYERYTVKDRPIIFKSLPWTKRIVFAHKDTVWTVIHPTHETDLKKIEDQVIAKSYEELERLESQTIIELEDKTQ